MFGDWVGNDVGGTSIIMKRSIVKILAYYRVCGYGIITTYLGQLW